MEYAVVHSETGYCIGSYGTLAEADANAEYQNAIKIQEEPGGYFVQRMDTEDFEHRCKITFKEHLVLLRNKFNFQD